MLRDMLHENATKVHMAWQHGYLHLHSDNNNFCLTYSNAYLSETSEGRWGDNTRLSRQLAIEK